MSDDAPPGSMDATDVEVLAHRQALRYFHRSENPNDNSQAQYVFDRHTLRNFVDALRRLRALDVTASAQRHTRSELLAMFGADYTSDRDVADRAGCCGVCFDPRECVDNMQCKANLSTLTRIAPDPAGVKAVDQRQRFEAWADDQGYPLKKLETSDEYLDLRTQGAWEAYQRGVADGVSGTDRKTS